MTLSWERPVVQFAYRYGLLGGVSTQLLNRYPVFERHVEMRVLYERNYGMTQRFPSGVAETVPTLEQQAEAIARTNPHILVVIDSPSFIKAWQLAGSPGRLVIEVHTTTANLGYLAELDPELEVAALVTVSRYMKEVLRETEIGMRVPIHVVPNCLGPGWDRGPEPIDLDGELPVLWVGKLDGHKRYRQALDVMETVVTRAGDRVRPVIVGGYTALEARIENLLNRIAGSPALRSVRWWPYVEYARMPLVYASVGAAGGGMFHTSINESFGMAMAEALMMGCPVVAPRVGALPELLPDEAMFEPTDWRQAEDMVVRMLESSDYRHHLLQTRDRVRQAVDPERAAEAFAAVVVEVLGSPVDRT